MQIMYFVKILIWGIWQFWDVGILGLGDLEIRRIEDAGLREGVLGYEWILGGRIGGFRDWWIW